MNIKSHIANMFDKVKPMVKKMLKSKSFYVISGIFLVVFACSIILISYSYYYDESNSSVIRGKASLYNADITLKIYLQKRSLITGDPLNDSSGNPIYERVYIIPREDYTFVSGSCSHDNITLTYNETNYKFDIVADRKGICEVYFTADDTDKIQGNANGVFRLFVETLNINSNTYEYIEVGELPSNLSNYRVNDGLTSEACDSATIDTTNKKIVVNATGDVKCDIYLYQPIHAGITLYVEELDYDSCTYSYVETSELPSDLSNYEVDENLTSAACSNTTIQNNKIEVNAASDAICDIYLYQFVHIGDCSEDY